MHLLEANVILYTIQKNQQIKTYRKLIIHQVYEDLFNTLFEKYKEL